MTLHLDHAEGRDALLDELAEWERLLGAFDDLDAPSRCAGWTCGQVLAHVHLGLQDVALALLAVEGPGEVTVDAAGYWTRYPTASDPDAGSAFLAGLVAAYARPAALTAHVAGTVRGLARGVERAPEGRIVFQDMTFSTGDFLGSWAVELAVHHLDLELIADPPAASALHLARRTVEDLTDTAVPTDWDDATAVLAGTGRVRLSDAEAARHPGLREALPVLR
ncbi:maleylpyruvate isomerase N-terminal domain-containing protein [Kineococcus endophyticus]|uniref:Maleylpyruvate isomerase N-terminal domain-containing protein n=1 Tax=Kineococcus endophyticus TaxID=1181883 RepID=A0ABV3P0J3_9ACTN